MKKIFFAFTILLFASCAKKTLEITEVVSKEEGTTINKRKVDEKKETKIKVNAYYQSLNTAFSFNGTGQFDISIDINLKAIKPDQSILWEQDLFNSLSEKDQQSLSKFNREDDRAKYILNLIYKYCLNKNMLIKNKKSDTQEFYFEIEGEHFLKDNLLPKLKEFKAEDFIVRIKSTNGQRNSCIPSILVTNITINDEAPISFFNNKNVECR